MSSEPILTRFDETHDAQRRVKRIRELSASITENVQTLIQLVHVAKASNDHEILGYASWTAYLVDVFGDEPLSLTRDVRRELVAELSAQGMSTRAIAPIVGVTRQMVSHDLRASEVASDLPPQADPLTGEVLERTVTGLDGKTYQATSAVVNAFLEDSADVQNARYVSNFFQSIKRAHDCLAFDAERLARLDPQAIELVRNLEKSLTSFRIQMEANQGLRLIQGSK
jgi:predicted transcriptional regulator